MATTTPIHSPPLTSRAKGGSRYSLPYAVHAALEYMLNCLIELPFVHAEMY